MGDPNPTFYEKVQEAWGWLIAALGMDLETFIRFFIVPDASGKTDRVKVKELQQGADQADQKRMDQAEERAEADEAEREADRKRREEAAKANAEAAKLAKELYDRQRAADPEKYDAEYDAAEQTRIRQAEERAAADKAAKETAQRADEKQAAKQVEKVADSLRANDSAEAKAQTGAAQQQAANRSAAITTPTQQVSKPAVAEARDADYWKGFDEAEARRTEPTSGQVLISAQKQTTGTNTPKTPPRGRIDEVW